MTWTATSGSGSGAQAVARVSNEAVIAVNVLAAGSGYTNTPVIVIAPPFIEQPRMGIAGMSLLMFTNLVLATNYQIRSFFAHVWVNIGPTFTTASLTLTESVSGTADPNGYRLTATPVPSEAYATSQVVNGFLVGATVRSGGGGYTTDPAVSVRGGGGTKATAIATVSGCAPARRWRCCSRPGPRSLTCSTSGRGKTMTHEDGNAYGRIIVFETVAKALAGLKVENVTAQKHRYGRGPDRRLYRDHYPVIFRPHLSSADPKAQRVMRGTQILA